jgi:hypothetical protein
MDKIEAWLQENRRQVLKRRLYAAVDYRATLCTGPWVPDSDLRHMTKLDGDAYEEAMAELVEEGYLEYDGRRFRLTAQEAWGVVPALAV